MTEPGDDDALIHPPPPPPEDIQNEPVRSKEKQELFPDEPTGPPARFKEKIDVLEAESVNVRNRAGDQADQARARWRDQTKLEGKLTFIIDGEDDKQNVFSCIICSALVLRSGVENHGRWHEGLKQRGRT